MHKFWVPPTPSPTPLSITWLAAAAAVGPIVSLLIGPKAFSQFSQFSQLFRRFMHILWPDAQKSISLNCSQVLATICGKQPALLPHTRHKKKDALEIVWHYSSSGNRFLALLLAKNWATLTCVKFNNLLPTLDDSKLYTFGHFAVGQALNQPANLSPSLFKLTRSLIFYLVTQMTTRNNNQKCCALRIIDLSIPCY